LTVQLLGGEPLLVTVKTELAPSVTALLLAMVKVAPLQAEPAVATTTRVRLSALS
jgi:hypothetical protein